MLQLSQRALTASDADGELFVDRSEELAAVERALGLGFSVYVLGPTGGGKTSLLRRLQARLGERVVYVNMARMETFRDLMAQLTLHIGGADLNLNLNEYLEDAGHVSDALFALRAAALEHAGDTTPIVLVDGLAGDLLHELFGRQRDELWEIPLRWVATGSSTLMPPADTFFETTVKLGPLAPDTMRELLVRRAATGNDVEQRRLEQLVESLPLLLDPATPRQLLATARTILLSPDSEAILQHLRQQRNVRVHLSTTASKVFDTLGALGPTHAGDERLLSEVGTTRSRIVQVFKELEDAGLVRSVRDGKRKLYGRDLSVDFVLDDPDSGKFAYVEVKRHAM